VRHRPGNFDTLLSSLLIKNGILDQQWIKTGRLPAHFVRFSPEYESYIYLTATAVF
jgi:hypothetical protein